MAPTKQVGEDEARVVYLCNVFPSAVEPYVGEEIQELEQRGVRVIPCRVWGGDTSGNPDERVDLTIFTWQPWLWFTALALCIQRREDLKDILRRLVRTGDESWGQRLRGLVHTLMGARLACLLHGMGVRHIHIHHGYLGAWIGMVAARFLRVPYSLTLHGSDLLLRSTFLDMKLQYCAICFTVSEFNRNYLVARYRQINPRNLFLQRIGVPCTQPIYSRVRVNRPFTLLTVGRLHPVKDHAFLIRGCAALKASGESVHCRIAGEGPQRRRLENLVCRLGLTDEIRFLGHVPRTHLAALFTDADLVVLTSRSEGIPLTLMEAMALGCPVLASAITGIPELVLDGKTGFLYRQGSITDFVDRVLFIRRSYSALGPICDAAHEHVTTFFNRETNLRQFSNVFLDRVLRTREGMNADSLLQQVQL